ncbi:OLC1v1017257C1 [Oldenlandia corymbosa var. corymbosa]|uniref:OLC1v1017257C1 n=1 Tax=Oldenlandia corymbosa var. corymbosa TaxID=529605 RepID=A0AAV1E8Z9_OLDCO|nr:OLC1v1017257C1 [Oldenlandia corymbosa var. corymbosa]
MFTEGLDNNALKWVREGSDKHKTEVPLSVISQRSRIDAFSSTRTGGRGVGLPPPSKFRSGHLSGVIPVSRVIPGDLDDSRTASDNDMSTDSEEEIYGGRYSLDSSPQDDRVPTRSSASRYRNPVAGPAPQYASDSLYSEDVNSSRETLGRGQGCVADRLMRGANRYSVGNSTYTEDESSDSAASSEFSTTYIGSNNGTAPSTRGNVSQGHGSGVSQLKTESMALKNVNSRNLESQKFCEEDVPSAPPFCGPGGDIKLDREKSHATKTEHVPSIEPEKSSFASRPSVIGQQDVVRKETHDSTMRPAAADAESGVPSSTYPYRLPTFHAMALGPWHAVIAYDACVRLCLNAWARGCMEAPMFLENECALLRSSFNLQQVLLQSEEELMTKRSSELPAEGSAAKPKKMVGKMKVQVRRVKLGQDPHKGCTSINAPKLKMEAVRYQISNLQSAISSGWHAVRRVRFAPRVLKGSISRQSLAYVHASTQYIKQVSGLLKVGVATLRSSSTAYELQEKYSCLLRLKSSSEEDAIRMQPGSAESHIFFPDGLGDDLVIDVQDSMGKHYGRVVAQVATIAEDPGEKLRWWCIYHEPEHEVVGRVQLSVNYSTSLDETNNLKCGSVAETVAYDLVLEVAMKIQHFRQRNLVLHGAWKWLLTEFASYFGVSDAYTKLRYLAYVMDVATPTADCLELVHDLLLPVIMKGHSKTTLSHQENRILGEIENQLEQIFCLVFENYKSLDESSPSGIMDVFRPATGQAAPALKPAVKLYSLLQDIFSPEAQNKLCGYFQVAAKKRSRRHLTETDEYVSGNNEGLLIDAVTVSTAYGRMISLCMNIRNEIFTDIEIHHQDILPSFIDLPNLSASIYSAELCNRLRAFLIACPPAGPSPPVTELVIATADFQRDLAGWNIKPVKGGVDAKELFHLYIVLWIQDKRLSLLESCKLDKVKWSGVRTRHATTPFIDDMYDRLKETLNDYDVIIRRWPEYTFVLENAVADVEKAIVDALEKQYADVLSPLKENLAPKRFGLKYVQKLTKRNVTAYVVPEELGTLLNSMKRMLDILRPKIEHQLKSWGSCIPDGGNTAPGERLSEVTVMLRSKFRNYLQAVVEKLVENSKLQGSTKMKKILQDSKDAMVESDVKSRMLPLKEQLASTINHLHSIFESHVFIACCRGYWDRMGQDILSFLESRKENRAWYKGSRIAVSVLDDTFASQMQQLLGNSLQEKDLEPPRSVVEVRSILCKDAQSNKGNSFYY